ncbi:hypothetical protein OEZ85_011978 [Tetradesmus obliquus]|uniref:Pentraxin (PTX) domain-containing protein n=1 Tax=Tetradesmus obliquus TaxID=3088 RepID=A0ABY8TRY1_TETOB|nr:hypothetical protein OEZ85_011978 [Tetradesmus obliquus]
MQKAVLCGLLLACLGAAAGVTVSSPGGAGHALLFRDHVVLKKDFKDFPTTAMTFEAWVSSSDFCHAGTIMSYAKDSKSTDDNQRIADFNHFVIFDPRNLLACHDFKYIDLKPDPKNESCHASYWNVSKLDTTAKYVERDGQWHHLAVSWSTADEGLTKIYWDGLLVASAYSHKTQPLEPGGAFMLGAEQDCFGGCTDPSQGFYGMMDEVRIWKTVRSQDDIIRHMRWASGLENNADLIAYWQFNDPDSDNGQFRRHVIAKDSSGKGNDLSLLSSPSRMDTEIKSGGNALRTGSLNFKNNVALNKAVKGMPEKSFSVEFWARSKKLDSNKPDMQEKFAQIFSYAAQHATDVDGGPDFMDDAIRIERYLEDFSSRLGDAKATSTRGAISVHINSNEHTDSTHAQNWIDFDAQWLDDEWHHVAVTWSYDDGVTRMYLDGTPKTAFWKNSGGMLDDKPASQGGVDPSLAARTARSQTGSLVLGQDQDCPGGCFSPSNSYNGELAVLRIWDRVLSADDVKRNMVRERPDSEAGLVGLYIFDAEGAKASAAGEPVATDRSANKNHLELRSNAPQWVYSYAPLVKPDGTPVDPPAAGAAGYALALHDRQVLILPNFQDFPSDAITVEFWMMSVDTCRPGVPFSYAVGQYEKEDNSFLIFNYNSFGVSVMEDEGTLADHLSGVAATDGQWHHVAVTWESSSGSVILYLDSREVWRVTRGKGKKIPSGGTLVIGREQDCKGGCFDSASGAAGKVSVVDDQEYGPQDFFGLIEEMRVWRVVRTPEQIRQGMIADDGRGSGGSFDGPGIDKDHKDLVAYWDFNSGAGYSIKDITNHGHDLIAAQPPRWEVVRWLSNCGNGVVEGAEQCDDGDTVDGDGCSSSCKIERGWSCSGNPSKCVQGGGGGGGPPTPAPAPTPEPRPTPRPAGPSGGGGSHADAAAGGGKKHASGGSIAAAVLVPVFVAVMCGMLFAYRHAVYEQFPQVESAVQSLQAAVGGVLHKPGGSRYAALSLDPEELDISPEFLSPTPARPPGGSGPYSPMPDNL